MEQTNLDRLYKALKADGYDMPGLSQFRADMADETKLRNLYNNLSSEYELPEWGEFRSDMGIAERVWSPQGVSTMDDAPLDIAGVKGKGATEAQMQETRTLEQQAKAGEYQAPKAGEAHKVYHTDPNNPDNILRADTITRTKRGNAAIVEVEKPEVMGSSGGNTWQADAGGKSGETEMMMDRFDYAPNDDGQLLFGWRRGARVRQLDGDGLRLAALKGYQPSSELYQQTREEAKTMSDAQLVSAFNNLVRGVEDFGTWSETAEGRIAAVKMRCYADALRSRDLGVEDIHSLSDADYRYYAGRQEPGLQSYIDALDKMDAKQRRAVVADAYRKLSTMRLQADADPEALRDMEARVLAGALVYGKQNDVQGLWSAEESYRRMLNDAVGINSVEDADAEIERIDEMIAERNAELDEAGAFPWWQQALSAGIGYILNPAVGPLGAAAGATLGERRYMDPELAMLYAAKHNTEHARKMLDWQQNERSWYYALIDDIFDTYTWNMGVTDLSDALTAMGYSDKRWSDADRAAAASTMLEAMASKSEVQRNFHQTTGQGFASMTAQMLPFMAQFWLTGGFSGVSEAAAQGGAKLASMTGAGEVSTWVMRNLGRVGGDFVAGWLMANTLGAARTVSDIVDRKLGEVERQPDGTYKFVHIEVLPDGTQRYVDAPTWGRAIFEGQMANTIENFTELLGGSVFDKALGRWVYPKIGQWFSERAASMGLSNLSKYYSQISNSYAADMTRKILRGAKIDDYPGELLEEETGMFLNAMFNTGENDFNDMLDPKQQSDLVLGMAFSMGFLWTPGMIGGAHSARKYRSLERDLERKEQLAAIAHGYDSETWKAWRERIDGTSNEDMADVMAAIMTDGDLDQGEKRAMADYVVALTKLRGFNERSNAAAREAAMDVRFDADGNRMMGAEDNINAAGNGAAAAYMEGAQAVDSGDAGTVRNIQVEYDAARAALLQLVGEGEMAAYDSDPAAAVDALYRDGNSDKELLTKAVAYMNAKAAFDGMNDAVRDNTDAEIAQSDALIDSYVARGEAGGDGMIHPAVLRGGKIVYILSGNAVLADDGLVDLGASDDFLVVMDGEGKASSISPSEIESLGAVVDPEALKQQQREAIEAENQAAAQSAQQGTLAMQVGDEYTIDWNGVQHNIEVLSDEGETVVVSIDGGEPRPMSKEQLQQLSNAAAEVPAAAAAAAAGTEDDGEGAGADNGAGTDDGAATLSQHSEPGDGAVTPAAEDVEEPVAVSDPWEAPIPTKGEGENMEPDWLAVTPERGHDWLFGESGLDRSDANEIVKNNLEAAQKAVDKASKLKPKKTTNPFTLQAERERIAGEQEAAQNALDYWKTVQSRQTALRNAELEQSRAEQAERDRIAHEQAVAAEEARQAEVLAQREEQAQRGAHAVHPAIREKWEAAPKIEGFESEIPLHDGTTVKGRYMLVESGSATPSHNAAMDFARSDGFPVDENGNTINDRDYERDRDAQDVTREMGRTFDSRAIQDTPVVSRDGVVLSGNGRTMAGELAARDNTDGAYLDHLTKFGRQYGFTPEQVSSMQHPRLVFVTDEDMPYTTETFAKFNAQQMKSQDRTETAVKLGKTVDDNTFGRIVGDINRFDTLAQFYNDPKASVEAINDLRRSGVINPMQYAEMFDGKKVSLIGRQMLENMLLGKAFESNPDALRELAKYPQLRQSVVAALAEISNNKRLGDYSLEHELSEAIHLAYTALEKGRKQGDVVSDIARQLNLFPFDLERGSVVDYTNASILMLADVLNSTEVNKLRNVLALYNDRANNASNGAMSIDFGGEAGSGFVESKSQIIRDVLNLLENEDRKEKQRAIDEARERRKDAAEAEQGDSGTEQDGTAERSDSGSAGAERSGGSETPVERESDLAQTEVTAPLSEEVDEFDKPFVISSRGTTTFGEVGAESGLTAAPIKLSLGENIKDENGANHGYGWLHIEAGHGDQIRAAGFSSVEEFVETVARNYDTIREGSIIADNQTYLLEISDEHNNTLFIQLSRDGSYWNVNSAGIFKKKYSRRKPEVFTRPALEPDTNTDTSGVDSGRSEGVTTPAGNSPQTSAGKGSENSETGKEKTEKVAESKAATSIFEAEQEVNTEPTEAQKEAGNYKKGHVKIDGYDVTIENPKGSVRRGTDASGKQWEQEMQNTYGYIRGTEGVDGDHIDVFFSEDPSQGDVFVVDQVNKDGSFDEHKVMYGFPDIESARKAYLSNYEDGWQGLGAITPVSKEEFKKWIRSSHRKTKPFAEYKSVKALEEPVAEIGGTAADVAMAMLAETEKAAAVPQPTEQAPAEPEKGEAKAAGTGGIAEVPKDKLEDVGEKIEGAKKDLARKMSERIDLTADSFPKMFPKYDLKKLISQGLDTKLAVATKMLRQMAQDDYKKHNRKRGRGKSYALESARFYAAYAKQILEAGDTSVDFTNEGWAFTDYGKQFVELNIKLFDALHKKLGDDLFDLDLSGVQIVPISPKQGTTYYRRNAETGESEVWQPAYGTRGLRGGAQYYEDGQLDKAIDECVKSVSESVDYNKSHPYKLSVYYNRYKKDSYYVGVKLGNEVKALTEPGPLKETSTYMKEHEAELQAKAAQLDEERKQSRKNDKGEVGKRWKPELALGGGRPRIGVDRRGGRDITPDEFRSTFNFRGVQFGNYVSQKERQRFINETYDALLDLADLLGISPKAISLDGRLGFAIGARGGGKAAAHYEPGENVINLTKTNGAGSLAHEWFHSLDYYFNRGAGRKPVSATSNERSEQFPAEVRDEMRRAFLDLMRTIKGSAYYNRSVALEQKLHPQQLGEGYYDKPTELGARAFQDYVVRRLSDHGQINDFLSSFTEQEKWNGEPENYPYPYGEEADKIDEKFDALFGSMREREDEQGNTVVYSRADGSVEPVSEGEAALRDGLVDLLRNAGVEVITDEAEGQRVLEAALRAEELLDEMKRKSAQETALPEGETSFKGTVISSADGAKVIQNLETLIKNAEKLDAAGQRNFLGEVAKALGARRYGSGSQYATFETVNGEVVTIRLADHNAHVSGFDNAGRDNGISIVISRKPNNGVLDDGDAHVVEFFYKDKDLRKADGSPYAAIVRSIEQALYSGEYKDTTGLAQREEVNGEELFTNFYTNKKASNQTPQMPNGDTPESARTNDNDANSGAKLQKVGDSASDGGEKVSSNVLFDGAKKKFGVTRDIREAGYVLPDGTMLDFSGRHELLGADDSAIRGRRATDHRAVGQIGWMYDENGDEVETGLATDMPDFIERGAIRIDCNAGTINLATAPTAAQRKVLRELIARNGGDVQVDFGNGWDSAHYAEYSEAKATRVLGDIERYFSEGVRPKGDIQFFRTEEGEVYGFVKDGKIYLDPRVATAETAVHEYSHLWADALRRANTEAWERLKQQLLGDKDLVGYVKKLYPELEGDALMDEVFAHYSGKRGAERLRAEQAREMESADGLIEKARVVKVFNTIRRALRSFWGMARDLFAGKNAKLKDMSAEDFADMTMADLLSGFDPRKVRGDASQYGTTQNGGARYSLSRGEEERNEITNRAMRGGYHMKAPNGKTSKLNEKQWAEVRTGNFKQWAGDWETDALYHIAQRSISDKDYNATYRFGTSERLNKDLTKLLGHDIYGIIIESSRIRHINDHHGSDESLRGQRDITPEDIALLPYLFDNYDAVVANPKYDDAFGHRAVEVIKRINGLTIVGTIERGKSRMAVTTNFELRTSDAAMYQNVPELYVQNDSDVAKVKKEVESRKKNLGNSSKIVDENGEPLVMTHNTPNEFYTFDRERIGSGQGQAFLGLGFNFSRGTNSIYGGREVKAYLDARNPLESGGHKLSQQNLMEALRKIDEGQSDTIVAELYGGYVPYDSPNYEKALRKVAKNLVEGYDDLGIYGTVSVVAGGARANDVIEAFKGLGFDSSIERNADGEIRNAVVFDPTQIKSATDNNGEFSRENPDIRYSLTKAPTFYSNAERAVENVKQEKAKAEQWKAMLTKAGGIKAGEDKWMGLSQWLDEHKGKLLTKDEVMQFIKDNSIEMEEVSYQEGVTDPSIPERVYDGFEEYYNRWTDDDFDTPLDHLEHAWDVYCNVNPRWIRDSIEPHLYRDGTWDLRIADRNILKEHVGINSDYSINRTRLEYTTEGLDNKREIAFVVDDIDPYQDDDEIHFGPENEGRAVMWVRFGETTDADGKRVLVIDEIQSNRHQDAREKGYREDFVQSELDQARQESSSYSTYLFNKYIRGKHPGEDFLDYATDEEKERFWELSHKVSDILKNRYHGVPAAPFEKNWHEVAMKRMLRLAAEEGFDKVAWTTGEQQAERYDLSKQVSGIEVRRDSLDPSTRKPQKGKYGIYTYDRNGYMILEASGEMSPERIVELFGKDLGGRMLAVPDGSRETISGEGLRIGGEGMKGFYDQMLPRFMDKYGKKWGVKTGAVTLDTPGKEVMHSVDVTPEMRESVMEGQPLFRDDEENIEAVNEQFNKRLDELESNPNQKDHVMHLGYPSDFLLSGGIVDAEIQLDYDKFVRKSSESYKANHPFKASDIKNLPKAIHAPIAVFKSKQGSDNVILTELVKDGRNFVVVIRARVRPRRGGLFLEVNKIETLYPKEAKGIVDWILKGLDTNANKEKALRWLVALQTHPETTIPLEELNDAAKLIRKKYNSKKTTEKNAENGNLNREGLPFGERGALAVQEVRGPEYREVPRYDGTGTVRYKVSDGEYTIEGIPGTYGSRELAAEAVRTHYPDYMVSVDDEGDIVLESWRSILPPGVRPNTYAKILSLNGVRMSNTVRKRLQRYTSREMVHGERAARELCRRLGVAVRFVKDINDIEGFTGPKTAKGWYDRQTGQVTVVVGNHNGVSDIIATVLHEVVTHKGLRELFGKDFYTFLDNVYSNVDEATRRKIAEKAKRRGWDFRTATEEYLAELAQSTDFDSLENQSVWSKVKELFMDLLRKAGAQLGIKLTDADLRYILWRSYHRLEQQGILGAAEESVMREQMRLDKEAEMALQQGLPSIAAERGVQLSLFPEAAATESQSGELMSLGGAKEMTDEELLAEIGNDRGDLVSVYSDEYDSRHVKEYNEAYDKTVEMLEQDGVTLRQLEEMVGNASRDVERHFADAERTAAQARYDALQDMYLNIEGAIEDSRYQFEEAHADELKQRFGDMWSDGDVDVLRAEYGELVDEDTPLAQLEDFLAKNTALSSEQDLLFRDLDDMTDEQVDEHLVNIKPTYGVKTRSMMAVLRTEADLGRLRDVIEDEVFDELVNKFNDPNCFGCSDSSTGLVFIFPHKQGTIEELEGTWWHENTHVAWADIEMSDKEDCGLAALEYLKGHDPYHYDMVMRGNYPKSKWAEEGAARFVQHLVNEYGADAFLNGKIEADNEKVAKLAAALQSYYVNGKEETNNQLRRGESGSNGGAQGRSGLRLDNSANGPEAADGRAARGTSSETSGSRVSDRLDSELGEEAEEYNAGSYTLEEVMTNSLLKAASRNNAALSTRVNAMRALGGDLMNLRQAMALQREYDRSTVDTIVRLAKSVIDSGYFNNMSRTEVKRLMGMINRAAGREDITRQADAVVDLLIQHQLSEAAALLHRQMTVRGSKINAKGVEVQGVLDINGQRMVKAMKDAMDLDEAALQERIDDTLDRMGSSDNAIADNATVEYQGLMLAKQYLDEITKSEVEEKGLRQELKQAKEDYRAGNMTREAYNEFVAATEDAIRQNRLERIEAYERLTSALGAGLQASIARAEAWRKAERQRVSEIHHNANSDLEGVPADEHRQLNWMQRMANWSIVRFFMKPLATFDQMLRFFGSKSVDGRGYLWNRFMGGWTDANEREWRNLLAAHKELDAKVSDVFGKNMRWSDLFAMERKMPKLDVVFWDGGEMKTHQLTQGNMLYIYMVNKMNDGKMKLRKMGITEDVVQQITEKIDPRFIVLADWLQNEFLKNKRNEYNAVHERLFGASMAAIENYFPLKINSRSRGQEEEIGESTSNETHPSTITGSIIKRRRNALPLDLTGADAFDVVLEHLQNMEHWAAFAELSRDMNTLLSYRRFRNRVMNMGSARYGAGKTLWKNFKDVCAIAAGVYHPMVSRNSLDTAMVNVSKGVTAAKISFRLYTALKQLLSYPAYLSEANFLRLLKLSNPIGAVYSWNWAMKELPGFSKRWQSRQAGDSRLRETDVDWRMWRNKIVSTASRMGMSPNAFIDGLTVAMGARAIYETKLARYKKAGYGEEDAKRRALRDASISYNETQQSNENAYLSAMQLDRTVASVALTIFRNASMGYQRKMFNALDNLKRKFKPGYRSKSIEFMQKQMVREGLSEEEALRTAKRLYNRSWYEDISNVFIFGFVMQLAWNLGPYIPYLLMGDDDDEKDKLLEDASLHALAGGVEGLSAGNVMSDLYNLARSGGDVSNYNFNLLPLMSDIQTTLRHFKNDSVAAWNDVFNLLVQSGIGVNPQTFTDTFVAIADYSNGNPETSREVAMLIMRIMSVPQSQLDKLYIDELGMTAADARKLDAGELARRYAHYKLYKGALLTGWAYSDDAKKAVEDRYIKRFENLMKERAEGVSDTDLELNFNTDDEMRRKVVGKEAAKRMGGNDTYGSGSSTKTDYGKVYADKRDYFDLAEDVLLEVEQKKAEESGDDELAYTIGYVRENILGYTKKGKETKKSKLTNDVREKLGPYADFVEGLKEEKQSREQGLGALGDGYDEDVMELLRDLRKRVIEELGIK